MGCHPSHWRTHIFQDGYCATNQFLCARFVYQRLDCLTMWTLGGLRWMSLWFFLVTVRSGRDVGADFPIIFCDVDIPMSLCWSSLWKPDGWTPPELFLKIDLRKSAQNSTIFHHFTVGSHTLPSFSSILPPFFARFCSICPPFSYIFPPEIAQHPVTGELVPHLQWRLSPPRTRHVGWGVRMMCCLNVMVNGMHGNRIRFEMIWLVVWNMNLIFSNISHNYMG